MRVGIVVLSAYVFGFLANGCGLGCDAAYCSTSASLELAEPLTEPGEYIFTLTHGGTTLTCTAVVPFRSGPSSECDDDVFVDRERITESSGNATSSRPGDAIVSVSLAGEPRTVSLTVTRDGTEIIDAEAAPTYEEVEVNGPGCGTCTKGQASIAN